MSLNHTGNSSRTSARPLFDPSQPYGIARYPVYRVNEVAEIIAFGRDKTTYLFRDGHYGPVHIIKSQERSPHRKRNYTTILIPYETLMAWMAKTRQEGVA